MIISIMKKKAYDKIEHPFSRKTQQTENRGNVTSYSVEEI